MSVYVSKDREPCKQDLSLGPANARARLSRGRTSRELRPAEGTGGVGLERVGFVWRLHSYRGYKMVLGGPGNIKVDLQTGREASPMALHAFQQHRDRIVHANPPFPVT
jgi:hypothetical protein